MDLTTDPTLRALVDRIIPADDGPSAGVGDFLQSWLTGELRERAAEVEAGLRLLDTEAKARQGGRRSPRSPSPTRTPW